MRSVTLAPGTGRYRASLFQIYRRADQPFALVLEFRAGVLVSLRRGERDRGEGRWDVAPVGPSHPPAYEGPVTVVVGPTAEEVAAASPSARLS